MFTTFRLRRVRLTVVVQGDLPRHESHWYILVLLMVEIMAGSIWKAYYMILYDIIYIYSVYNIIYIYILYIMYVIYIIYL